MENQFKLIENVIPSKTPFRMKDKFAKLTLSSNKKTKTDPIPVNQKEDTMQIMYNVSDDNSSSDNEIQQRKDEILMLAKKKSVSRSLLHELLLTDDDDESENEIDDGLNRLFLSKTSLKSNVIQENIHKDSKTSTQLMDKLQISDSDVTNCSEYESTHSSLNMGNSNDDDDDRNKPKSSTNMEHLTTDVDDDKPKQSSSENLFDTNDNEKNETNKNDMEILSAQVEQLGIKSPPPNQKIVDVENQCLSYGKRISEADTLSMTITTIPDDNEHKITDNKCQIICPSTPPCPQRRTNCYSTYTVDSNSSSSSAPNETLSISETDNDDDDGKDDDDDDGSEVIVISDSNSETSSPNLQISEPLNSKRTISLPNSEDNIKDELLKDFLDNIPPVHPGIECLSTYEESSRKLSSSVLNKSPPKFSQKIKKIIKEENESLIIDDDSFEKSIETENDIEKAKNFQQNDESSIENHQIPKNSNSNENIEMISSQQSELLSSGHVEKINISATIKIKLQIKEPTITYTIVDSPSSSPSQNDIRESEENDDSQENVLHKTETESSNKIQINDENSFELTKNSINLNRKERRNDDDSNENLKNIENNSDNDVEIDNMAKNLLTKLYGNEWKTPDVIKKLDNKTLSNTKIANESSLNDFTKFRRNIFPDLQSTKLKQTTFVNDNLEDFMNFKQPITEIKSSIKENNDLKENKENQKDNKNEQKNEKIMSTGKKRLVKIKSKRLYRIASDSSSSSGNSDDSSNENEKDFSADSDSSWNKSDSLNSSFSNDDTETDDNLCERKNLKLIKKKKSNKITYLDLTDDFIRIQKNYKSPPAEKDATFREKLENILKVSEYKNKPKIQITPVQSATKTKRKLFTPKYDEEYFNIELENNIQKLKECSFISNSTKHEFRESDNEEDDDVRNSVKLKYLLPPAFNLINKQIESVKTDTAIGNIKTPQKEFKTPTTVRKQKGNSAKKETPNSKNCENNNKIPLPDKISTTPLNKYGFLRSLDVTICKSYCHPEALYYRENFKTKRDELTTKLYNLYNEKVFDNKLNLNITWNKKLLKTSGRCFNKRTSGERISCVELSEKVITSPDRLRSTLIHELCHAATWIFNGENGHGITWKRWAKRANAIFPELPEIKVCHNYKIEYKYTYKCTLCQAKSHAHSKSKKTENIRCAYCHGAIEVFLNRKDKEGHVVPTPVREPKGFAKFVKDNYKLYKTPDRKHVDVMKLLSNKFSSLNVKDINKK